MTQPLEGEAESPSAHEQLRAALEAAASASCSSIDGKKQRLATLIAAYCNSVRCAAQRGTTKKRKTSVAATKLLRCAVEIGSLELVRALIPQYEDACTSGDQPLIVTACAFGRLEIAKFLVEHGAILDTGEGQASPLYAACAGGHFQLVQWLVADRKVEPSAPGAHGKTPLVVAIENGALRIFQYLLFMGTAVSANGGDDVYMTCAYLGNLGMVQHFLELALTEIAYSGCQVHLLKGAVHGEHAEIVEYILQLDDGKISSIDINDNLCIAAKSEDPDVAEVLLNHNADVDYMSRLDATPIYGAVTCGNLKTVELLLKRGASVTKRASFKLESALYEMAKLGRVDMLQLVHELRGDKVDFGAFADNTKHAPLHAAAAHGHTNVARFLLQADPFSAPVDVDVRSASQDTPLLLAAHEGHLEAVDLLVTHGADIDKCKADRSTPLIEAAEAGHFAVVQYLCEHGADPNAVRDGGLSALCVAARHNFPCIVEYLTNWGRVDPFAFHVAVVEGNIDVVRVLLSLGDTNINERADLLCQAALRGYLDLVVLLTSRGCNVNGRYNVTTDDHHITVTALTMAALSGNLEIVKYLCEHGADVDGVTDEDETALFLAAGKGHEDVVTYLVREQKANVEFVTRYTFTPADIANCMAEHDVLYYLLEHGASAPERHNLDYFSYVVLSREDVAGLAHEQQRDIEVWDRFFAFDMFLKGDISRGGISSRNPKITFQLDREGQEHVMSSARVVFLTLNDVYELLPHDDGRGGIVEFAALLKSVKRSTASDPLIAHMIELLNYLDVEYVVLSILSSYATRVTQEETKAGQGIVLGTSTMLLDGTRITCRTQESNLGNFVTDAIRGAFGTADIAIISGGYINGEKLHSAGLEITRKWISSVFEIPNASMLIRMRADDLRAAMFNMLSRYPDLSASFPQVSGIFAVYDTSQKSRSLRLYRDANHAEIADNDELNVATSEFVVNELPGFKRFELVLVAKGPVIPDIVADFVRKEEQIVYPLRENRIVIVE